MSLLLISSKLLKSLLITSSRLVGSWSLGCEILQHQGMACTYWVANGSYATNQFVCLLRHQHWLLTPALMLWRWQILSWGVFLSLSLSPLMLPCLSAGLGTAFKIIVGLRYLERVCDEVLSWRRGYYDCSARWPFFVCTMDQLILVVTLLYSSGSVWLANSTETLGDCRCVAFPSCDWEIAESTLQFW